MYCGDDVDAIVGDLGTGYSKFGLAGEDSPSIIVPSAVGYTLSSTSKEDRDAHASRCAIGDRIFVNSAKSYYDLHHPIQACTVQDWPALERLWEHAFQRLHIDPKEHPVLTSTVSITSHSGTESCNSLSSEPKDAEKYMEMMFETFQTPAFYISPDSVLSAFAFGRSAALIVDIGAGAARVFPIFDGYALHGPAQFHASLGMNAIDAELEKALQQANPQLPIQPRCFFEAANPKVPKSKEQLAEIPLSYSHFMRMEIVRDVRESLCVVSDRQRVAEIEKKHENFGAKMEHELPDGTRLAVGEEHFRVPELLFTPKSSDVVKTEMVETSVTLHKMVYDAVKLCDADLRRDMLNSIILCGGGSLTPGLMERLHAELSLLVPSSFKIRFLNMMKTERRFSTFIGGSILASLGSFQQLWVSRSEYHEHGASSICANRLS